MAEGLLRAFYGDKYDVYSAGTEATSVKPLAIDAMAELGIDISAHTSKVLTAYDDRHFAWVVTVCDSAKEACPVFPGSVNRLHRTFSDPSEVKGSEEDRRKAFRKARDELRDWIDLAFGK
ncbi:MAG: arsenate reductase ArsC [Rhodothermia bacterium]|nr:MAG: arsenate reductase ArsC [Rhodothermia bacterium]